MVLKLHGAPGSTATKRVAVILHEKQVPFELVPVDTTKLEQKQPSHLVNQPFGQIPFIDDDGFILYESRAIGRYIATKWANQGTPLIPTGEKELAILDQAISAEITNFEFYAAPAVREKVIKPSRGLPNDINVYKQSIAALDAKLDGYEAILSKQKYVAGNELTIADLFHLPFGSLLPDTGSDVVSKRPNFARWLNEISTRPSWLAVRSVVKSVDKY
ncbi:hypothetical protein AX16_005305 [Volvariella volvacea WC 439]|nr:hypothetical protein AX16_005305 [Volvariella volvacea WC 439]